MSYCDDFILGNGIIDKRISHRLPVW